MNLFNELSACCFLKCFKTGASVATSDFTDGCKPGLAKRPVTSFRYAM